MIEDNLDLFYVPDDDSYGINRLYFIEIDLVQLMLC